MERYIAIDNVCAWPNLTKMPDGSIVATIFNQPCHGYWEGDVECWGSEDGGRIWRLRGTPAVHEPGTNRMNVAAGLAANGDLVVIASGWSHRPPKGQAAGHESQAHPLTPWVCRSGDGGRTWERAESVRPPAGQSSDFIPFGDIVQLHDGTLGVCFYWGPAGDRWSGYFYASDDDGRSWRMRSVIQEGGINETAPLVLPDGQLLACARTEGDEHLELYRSRDHGRTWQREQAVSQASEHPAHLLCLPEGMILLVYGNRRRGPHNGIDFRLSDDAGRSWSPPTPLVTYEPADGGYPSSALAGEGRLVTAWYSRAVAAHQRYHMGALVWDLEQRCYSAPALSWLASDLVPKAAGIADAPYRGLAVPLGWRPLQAAPPDGFINMHDRFGDADGIVYIANRFHVPLPGRWGLRIGHDGGVRVFVDGQSVLTEPETRSPAAPGRSRVEVSLDQGDHEIAIALDTAAGKGWGIFFTWLMPKSGRKASAPPAFPTPLS